MDRVQRTMLSTSSVMVPATRYSPLRYSNEKTFSLIKVPVNREMIKAVQKSSAIYKEELAKTKAALEKLENERKERENADEIHQQTLREEDELLTSQRDLQRQQEEVNGITSDGSSRLQAAIRKKDSISIDSASILIEGCNVRSKSISEQLSKVTDDLMKIQKKRKDAHRSVQQHQKRQKATDAIDWKISFYFFIPFNWMFAHWMFVNASWKRRDLRLVKK